MSEIILMIGRLMRQSCGTLLNDTQSSLLALWSKPLTCEAPLPSFGSWILQLDPESNRLRQLMWRKLKLRFTLEARMHQTQNGLDVASSKAQRRTKPLTRRHHDHHYAALTRSSHKSPRQSTIDASDSIETKACDTTRHQIP